MTDQDLKGKHAEMSLSQTATALKKLFATQQQEKFSFSKFKILFPYFKKQKGYIIIVFITSILSAVILLPVPILIQFIIDKYIKISDTHMIIITALAIVCLYILSFFLKVILNYVFSSLNNKLLLSIKQDLTEKIITLPLSFFSETQSGYLVSRINEINNLGSMFSIMFISLMVSALTFLCSFIILSFLAWQILIISLLLLPLQFFIVKKFTVGFRSVSKTMMENSAVLNKNMQEVVSGIQTVKSFASENKEKHKINSSIQSVYRSSLLQNIFLGVSQEIIGFVSNFSNLLVLLISAFLIINKQFTIGLYVACLQYVNNLFSPISAFASAGMVMQPMIVAINRITQYFEIIGEDKTSKRDYEPDSLKGKIEFQNLSFYYEKDKEILSNISFLINPGEKVAICGANGTGKTTLLKLLLQLHLPQKGIVLFDNLNAASIKLTTLRKKIGFVSQDVFLFNDTIRNNLVYGCEDFSEDELAKVISRFCPFINDFPNGIHTMVGERGNNLSGGQKQAISIVRTILKRPDLLLFDEGNTSLDTYSKDILLDLVNEYFYNKTCLFITHNDLDYYKPDKIFTLDKTT